MNLIDTSKRSTEPETMDDFSMEGEVLRDALNKIASINRLLGGNKVTLQGIEEILKPYSLIYDKEITILDVGCGNGDMLRYLADYAAKKGLHFKLVGIDANEFTIGHARKLSQAYANISYSCADIFEDIKKEQKYDIILCTLTLHHFSDEDIEKLMHGFNSIARRGIVVNDLHRSLIAYYLFLAICFVFKLNKMSRDDGLISIKRGFKKVDLLKYSTQLSLRKYTLRWKWAFRYQWIIHTI